jgi:CRISPR-associated protein Cmr1
VVVRLFGTPRIGVSVANDVAQLPGLSYMFWSVFQQKRDAILPGERFRFRLHLRPYPFPAVEVRGRKLEMTDSFELALAALWLFVRLGGVGARSRRCAGGARAVAAPAEWPARLPSLVSRATTPAELAAELSTGLKQVRGAAGWEGPPPGNPSSYDILHERVCLLYLAERTFPTWWDAVNWAGETFHAFRVEHKLDASGIAALLTQGRIAVRTIQRAALGLPIGFFFKSIFAELTGLGVDSREARRKASASVGPGRGLGRASPVFFRVVPLCAAAPGADSPAAYAVLMGVFRSVLVPDHELTVKPGDFSIRPQRLEAPRDFAVYDRWFDHVRAQGVGLSPITLS